MSSSPRAFQIHDENIDAIIDKVFEDTIPAIIEDQLLLAMFWSKKEWLLWDSLDVVFT